MSTTNPIKKYGRMIGCVFIAQVVAMILSLAIYNMMDSYTRDSRRKADDFSTEQTAKMMQSTASYDDDDDDIDEIDVMEQGKEFAEAAMQTSGEIMDEGKSTLTTCSVMQWIAFLISIASAIYGIVMALKLKKQMPANAGVANILMLITFCLLALGSLISYSAAWGVSVQLYLAMNGGPGTIALASAFLYAISVLTMVTAYILYARKNITFSKLRLGGFIMVGGLIVGLILAKVGARDLVSVNGQLMYTGGNEFLYKLAPIVMVLSVVAGYAMIIWGWFKIGLAEAAEATSKPTKAGAADAVKAMPAGTKRIIGIVAAVIVAALITVVCVKSCSSNDKAAPEDESVAEAESVDKVDNETNNTKIRTVDAFALMCEESKTLEAPDTEWQGTINGQEMVFTLAFSPHTEGDGSYNPLWGSYTNPKTKQSFVIEGSYAVTNKTGSQADIEMSLYERDAETGLAHAMMNLKGKCTRNGCNLTGTYFDNDEVEMTLSI